MLYARALRRSQTRCPCFLNELVGLVWPCARQDGGGKPLPIYAIELLMNLTYDQLSVPEFIYT